MQIRVYLKEACVETFHQAITAEQKGADRIELCARLDLDGTTPSREHIEAAKETGIPVRVMIRPRGGDFIYSRDELGEMLDSINLCKELGVEGVVFGIQRKDRSLDYEQIENLARAALPLKVVIHKAIDETPDPVDAVRKLKKIKGVSAILTSGGKKTALEGKEVLKQMLNASGGQVEIVVAGKVTNGNIDDLHNLIGADAYHGKKIVGDIDS